MTVLDHLIRTPLITAELLLSLPTRWSPKDISCPRTPGNRGVRTDFVEARVPIRTNFYFYFETPGSPLSGRKSSLDTFVSSDFILHPGHFFTKNRPDTEVRTINFWKISGARL